MNGRDHGTPSAMLRHGITSQRERRHLGAEHDGTRESRLRSSKLRRGGLRGVSLVGSQCTYSSIAWRAPLTAMLV
jgi:hypothetical protein